MDRIAYCWGGLRTEAAMENYHRRDRRASRASGLLTKRKYNQTKEQENTNSVPKKEETQFRGCGWAGKEGTHWGESLCASAQWGIGKTIYDVGVGFCSCAVGDSPHFAPLLST